MSYFAQSAFENIRSKVLRLRDTGAPQRKLIVTTTVFPPDVTLELAKKLDEFALKDADIVLTFRTANNVADEWRRTHEELFCEMDKKGWIDHTGNLAGYRNAPQPPDEKLGLTVLAGADKVTDASSLADFYRCDPNAVWQDQMGKSFAEWITKRLDQAHIGDYDTIVPRMDTVLSALVELGCADLFQAAQLLKDLPLEANGAQNGMDALRILLKGLRYLQLPSFSGFRLLRRKKLTPYLESAIRFFRYDMFLEERTKKKALKAIESLEREKAPEIFDNNFFTEDERGTFTSDRAFIKAAHDYVQNEDSDARNRLYESDFIAIHDKILNFKEKKEPPPPSVKKLSGGPVEVVLTASGYTFREARRKYMDSSEIKSIIIKGEQFRHDSEGLSESLPDSQQELAKEYLRRLVEGVDRYFADGYLDVSGFENGDIEIISELYHEDVSFTNARTAEPSLRFQVKLAFSEDSQISREFLWRLPETQTYRMAEELIKWTADSITKQHAGPAVLPVFHIRYHEELMRAKDDDETRRVLLHAIRDVMAESTNLITEEWRRQSDPMLPYLQDLAVAYGQFIHAALKNGLHSVFHKDRDEQPSAWEILRRTYEVTMRAYLGEDEECRNSPMAAMLMRAFLMVAPRDGSSQAWVADPFERSGIATVLHPSVLEMLCDHILYLFACFNYAAPREWRFGSRNAFPLSMWQDYLDLAAVQMPISGLIGDQNRIVDTQVRGQELLHRIGSPTADMAPLSTRLLLRYEGFDDDDIADAEMFAETRESRLLDNILSDYLAIHPHARDGISLAIYRNKDIQPVVSAMHNFLLKLYGGAQPLLSPDRQKPYAVAITVFTEAGEDVGVARWIEQWKERWEAAESEEKYAAYRYCRFSISHRVVPGQDVTRKSFARMIRDTLDVDIVVLYDFIGAGLTGNEFQQVQSYDVRERTLKFPIIEKSFCTVDDPHLRLRRARVISNPQFRLASLHLEIMARLKYGNNSTNQEHVLIGYGDFEPWQEAVDEFHKRSEWVVCIDPSIDDKLIKLRKDIPTKAREIIGFGSGVGPHGELNFTISTEHFGLSDICFRLERAMAELYPGWDTNALKASAESVIRESQSLSGVSLIRATGVGTYLHDFMAYCLTNKILEADNNLLCSHLVSLDAYRHWFTQDDETRPDLLWLTARLDPAGRILLDMHLIECKLALRNDDHVEKAVRQVQNGLTTLIPAFLPRAEKGGDDIRPDQRYWWLQLHRLIASKTGISRQRQDVIMAAMERLADGDYAIAWHAAVLAFWTDSESTDLERTGDELYENLDYGRLKFGIYAIGREAVKNLCTGEKLLRLDWREKPIIFGFPDTAWKEVEEDNGENVDPVHDETAPYEKKPLVKTKDDKETLPLPEPEPVRQIPERIFLGKTVSGGRDVYWEFGHRELSNRHLLVFGTSGMGKTYAIQCLLCEMGRQAQNALIMDYTNGFLPNQLEDETRQILDPLQHIVRQKPLPVSPFKMQVQEIGGGLEIAETNVSAAKRIAGTFCQVYETLGDQQYSVLLDAIMTLVEGQSDQATLEGLLGVLESFVDDGQHDKPKVLSTISKLRPFVLERPFTDEESGLDWRGIFSDNEHRCHVFQFAGMDSLLHG